MKTSFDTYENTISTAESDALLGNGVAALSSADVVESEDYAEQLRSLGLGDEILMGFELVSARERLSQLISKEPDDEEVKTAIEEYSSILSKVLFSEESPYKLMDTSPEAVAVSLTCQIELISHSEVFADPNDGTKAAVFTKYPFENLAEKYGDSYILDRLIEGVDSGRSCSDQINGLVHEESPDQDGGVGKQTIYGKAISFLVQGIVQRQIIRQVS